MSTVAPGDTYQPPQWDISDRLRKVRELAGMSQQELAEAIGASRRTIATYESPSWTKPRRSYFLREWARVTGHSVEWIVWGEAHPDPGPGGPISVESASPCTRSLTLCGDPRTAEIILLPIAA